MARTSENGGGNRQQLATGHSPLWREEPVRWEVSGALVPYPEAMARMDAIAAQVAGGELPEHAWLLEHPPLITAGTSARDEDLLNPGALPVYRSGRGGQLTWHGPGQRVAYLILDLRHRGRDVRAYVAALEQWIIDTLADFGIRARREEALVGVWVDLPSALGGGMAKIAAIGVRVSRWVTRHGMALNVRPDLSHYDAIVPCGVRDHGVTSLRALGVEASMREVDAALLRNFRRLFGPVESFSQDD